MITILTFHNPQNLLDNLDGVVKVMTIKIGVNLLKTEIYFKDQSNEDLALYVICGNPIVKGYSRDLANFRLTGRPAKSEKKKAIEIPRREKINGLLPAEVNIKNLIKEVESLGEKSILNDVLFLMKEANGLLSDYFDRVKV